MADELGIAFQKVGGTASTLQVPFEKVSAYIAVVSSKTREAASTIGDGIKSIMARYEQLREKGFNEEDGTKVSQVAKSLASVGVQLMDQQGQFRNFGTVMDELGAKWSSLDSRHKAYIATTMAGTYQQSRFLNLMNNYDEALKLTDKAMQSAGTTQQKYDLYLQGTQAHIDRMKNSLEGIWQKTFDSSSMKAFVDALNSLLQVSGAVIDKLGFMPSVVGLVVTSMLLFNKTMRESATSGRVFTNVLTGLELSLNGVKNGFRGLASATIIGAIFTAASIAVEKLIGSFVDAKQHSEELKKQNDDSVKSWSAHGNEIEKLVKKYEELDGKKLDSEQQKEYVNVQNQLNKLMPVLTDHIDEQGNAHLRNVESIKSEINYVKELKDNYDKVSLANFDKNVNDIYDKLATKRKEITSLSTPSRQYVDIAGDGKTKSQESDTERLLRERQLIQNQRELQLIEKEATDATKQRVQAYLDSSGASEKLTEADKKYLNNLVDTKKETFDNAKSAKDFKDTISDVSNNVTSLGENLAKLRSLGDLTKNLNPAVMVQLTKDQVDAIVSFNGHMDGNLKSWDRYVGILKEAKVPQEVVNNLIGALKDKINGVSSGTLDLGKIVQEVTSSLDKFVKANTDLSSAYDKLKNGQQLSGKEIADLITKYPELSSAVENHSGVLTLNKKAVEDLMKAKELEFKSGLQTQLTELDNQEKALTEKLKMYDKEIQAIESLAQAKDVASKIRMDNINSGNVRSAEDDMIMNGGLEDQFTQLAKIREQRKAVNSLMGITIDSLTKEKKAANEAAQAYKNEEDHLQKLYEIKLKNNEADIANTEYLMSQAKKGSQEKIALIQKEIDLKQQRIKLLEEEKKREQEVAKNTPVSDNSPSVSVSGNSNASKIWNFLSQKGLNSHAVAGIMGNLQQENSLNTDDNSGGLGIAQWLGERRQGVIEYAKQIGASYESLEAQLGYLWKEISSGSQGVTVDKLNSMSASDGAKYFSDKFERPNANYAMNNKRMQYANEFYNQYSGSNVDGISKSMNTYVKVADEAALKTADFDSQIAKLREEILKLSWDEITESLAGYDEANKKLDQDIEGSKSHLFQYNEASKEYRDELDKQIPLLKQKQDNLHLEAEAIRATLAANEQADEQHKLTAVQVDELNQKLQQLGISWWNLQGDIKSVNDQLEKSKLDEVVQNTTDKIDEFQNKVNELKDTLDLLPNGSYKDRDNIMVQLSGDYQNQINIYKNSISQLEELNNSLDKNSDAYRNNQKQILSYQSTIRGLYKDEKQLKDDLNNQIADKLSTLKQDSMDYLKQQHDKQEKNLEDNIKAEEKSYDTQIEKLEKKLKLLDDEYEKEDRNKKLQEVNDDLNKTLNDKRYSYITEDGKEILTYNKEKVDELTKQRDELLAQYKRDDIKKAMQDDIDSLKKQKDDRVEILRKQLDDVKTKNQQDEEETSRHWDRLIEGAKNGTLTQSQIMDSWFKNQVGAMGNFRGEVTTLVDQIKTAFEALNQIKINPIVIPPPIVQGGFVPGLGNFTPSGSSSSGSSGGSYSSNSGVYSPDGHGGSTFTSGSFDHSSSSTGTRASGTSGGITTSSSGGYDYNGSHYNSLTSALHDAGAKGYDTGGFTGTFEGGKAAILHQKELVLNQMDTSNILKAVNLVRNLPKMMMPNLSSLINKQPAQVDQSKTYQFNNVTIKSDDPLNFLDQINWLIRSQTT